MAPTDASPQNARRPRTWLLLVVFLGVYLAPLGVRPLSAPDEFRYAEIGREMLASGDWVVPRLDGLLYFEKPILGYWQIAASLATFGRNAFAARLPSAFATGLTAALLVLLIGRTTGDREQAKLTGIAFLTSLMPFVVGTTAILDAGFTLFVTAGMVFTFLALREPSPRRADGWWLGAGVAAGLAFLTKGPLGMVVPGVALLPFLILSRRLAPFLRRLWLPALSAVVVIAPWSVAIGRSTTFWHRFIWVEHIQRFTAAGDNQHSEPIWFFVGPLLAALLPWLVLLPAAIRGLRTGPLDPPRRALRLFAWCWLVMPFLLFSASSGKLETYILPCVPPALILILDATAVAVDRRGLRTLRWPMVLTTSVGVLLTLGVLWAVRFDARIAGAAARNPLGWWALGLGTAAWAGCGLAGLASRSADRRVLLVALSPVVFLIASGFAVDDSLMRTPGAAITEAVASAAPDAILIGDRDTAQALAWIARRSDIEVFGDAGELAFGLDHDPGRALLTPIEVDELRAKGVEIAVLLSANRWRETEGALPVPDRVLTTRRFALALYHRVTS